MTRLLDAARTARPPELRPALAAFADLLDRHVRWEERELLTFAEANVDADALASIGGELEKRLALARSETKTAAR